MCFKFIFSFDQVLSINTAKTKKAIISKRLTISRSVKLTLLQFLDVDVDALKLCYSAHFTARKHKLQ